MGKMPTPPKIAKWILGLLVRSGNRQYLLGDLEQVYLSVLKERGKLHAYLWYWYQAVIPIPDFIMTQLYWSFAMFKNYFKVAIRAIRKNKLSSIINILGLSAGISCCILLFLWVQDEISFDRFHTNSDRLYRVIAESSKGFTFTATPGLLGPTIEKDFAEIELATRLKPSGRILLNAEGQSYYENSVVFADQSLFKMFTFQFLKGNPENILSDPGAVVITESKSKQYFGDDDPLGKVIQINDDQIFRVAGVLEDIKNSTLQFDFILPFLYYEKIDQRIGDWGRYDFETYVLLNEKTDPVLFESRIAEYIGKFKEGTTTQLRLQPMTKIHLHGLDGMGRIIYVYLFSVIAFIVLLIACINFVNLTTAKAGKKAKEIGLRKVIGAKRSELIKQLMGETVLLTLFAFLISIVSLLAILPPFNALVEKELELAMNGKALLGFLSIALFAGIASGIYPAFFLSAYQPVNIMKKTSDTGTNQGSLLRKPLMLFQYMISAVLIIVTLVVYDQLNFIQQRALGFDKDAIVYIPLNKSTFKQYFTIKEELAQQPDILGITATEALPTYMANWTSIYNWDEKVIEGKVKTNTCSVDRNFLKVFGIELIEGTDIADDHSGESRVFIVNEEFVRQTKLDSPINKRVNLWGRYNSKIVGVVKDFHFRPLTQKIEPLILHYNPGTSHDKPTSFSYICIKLNMSNVQNTMASIENTIKNFAPEYPFEYSFLDQRIENMYKAEKRTGTIFSYFSILAIIISCMGLFGLVSFTAEQRTKEIAVRKVLGASISKIMVLITKEFFLIIVVANIIAWPIAYYALNLWLQNFAYRVALQYDAFIISGVLTAMISVVATSCQILKASQSNPVDALRAE